MLPGPTAGLLAANFLVPALNVAFNWQIAFQSIGVAVSIVGILVFILLKVTDDLPSIFLVRVEAENR